MVAASLARSVLIALLLAGCAGQSQILRPQDFPLHSTDDPFFDVHWRLNRADGAVEAEGIVEAARVDGVAEVFLQLQEVDASGKVVKSAIGRTRQGRLYRWTSRPFAVSLRPVNPQDRFELRVWAFEWDGGRDRAGRN
jgi:hypothetical protein